MGDFLDFIDDNDSGSDTEEEEDEERNKQSRVGIFNKSVPELLANRPTSCGVLKFHNGIEESLIVNIERDESIVTAEDVLSAVDHYCYSRHWMMHIGPEKGRILDDTIRQTQGDDSKPLVCVELGSYCGYSTVRIASQLKNKDSVLYSIEYEPKCCDWTRRLCSKAGVLSKVKILEGEVSSGIDVLLKSGVNIDILFIDHDKHMYLDDLMRFESSALLKTPGAVVVADNVLSFGVPLVEYLEHVRKPVDQGGLYCSSTLHRSAIEYSTASNSVESGDEYEDGIEISYLN